MLLFGPVTESNMGSPSRITLERHMSHVTS